jgi:hypothetical protein
LISTNVDKSTGSGILLKREYPDPRTAPAEPSWQQPRPHLTLSELIAGQYVYTTARIAYVKTSERIDALGTKLVFTGVLEDSTFKAPFVSHRISYPLIRNSVYRFNSAYVHEFGDKSQLLAHFFAGGDSLVIPAGVQKFIENKKSTLRTRLDEVVSKAIRDLKIGDLSLGSDAAITEQKPDLQTQLLQETRQRLFGRNVSAWGSVLAVHDELWYLPNQVRFS